MRGGGNPFHAGFPVSPIRARIRVARKQHHRPTKRTPLFSSQKRQKLLEREFTQLFSSFLLQLLRRRRRSPFPPFSFLEATPSQGRGGGRRVKLEIRFSGTPLFPTPPFSSFLLHPLPHSIFCPEASAASFFPPSLFSLPRSFIPFSPPE